MRHLRRSTLIAVVAVLALPALAVAAWTTAGGGSGYATAKSMPAGNTPSGSVSNRDVTVNWTASSGGAAVSGYQVKRYDNSNNLQTIGSGCSGTISGTSCTENGVPGGTWKYTVTPVTQNWTGAESAKSSAVTVNAPSLSLNNSTITTALPATLSGSMANFIPNQTVSFRLDNPTSGTVLTGSISPTPVQSSGSATVSVTIPSGTSTGSHTVYAIGSSGDQASASITVDNAKLLYGGTGAATSRTNNGTSNVAYPAGTSQNDVVLLVEVNSANQNPTTPSGWTLLADQSATSPSQFRFTVWWKLAGASETSVPLAFTTNASGASAWVTRYYRPSGYPPNPTTATATVPKGAAGATSTLTPSPDLTTNASNATVISIAAARAANTLSLSTPQGFTSQLATTAGSGASGKALGFADQVVSTSGSSPASPTWSQSGTAAQWEWATVAFN